MMEQIGIGINRVHDARLATARENKHFYFFLLTMLIFLFLKSAVEPNIPVVIFLAISTVLILFGTQNQIIAFAVSCIPMSTGFQYKYAIFMCLIVYLTKIRYRLRIKSAVYPILLMMLWEFLHFLYGRFSMVEFFRCFAELLFLAVVLCMDLKEINYKLIFRSLAMSTVGVCLIMLYLQLQKRGFSLAGVISRGFNAYRFGAENTNEINFGLNFNVNGLGFICNMVTTGMLYLYGRREHTILDVMLLILSVIFGLMTLSRTYVICLAFVVMCHVFASAGTRKRKVLGSVGMLLIASVAIMILEKYMPQVRNDLISRFLESDVTNGRDTLFAFYNRHIFSSAFYGIFGIGLQDFQTKISAIYGGVQQVCHNGFQEIWVAWGAVGVILFLWLIFAMINTTRRYSGKRQMISYVSLGLMLLYTSAGQLIRSELALLSLTLISVFLSISSDGKKR